MSSKLFAAFGLFLLISPGFQQSTSSQVRGGTLSFDFASPRNSNPITGAPYFAERVFERVLTLGGTKTKRSMVMER